MLSCVRAAAHRVRSVWLDRVHHITIGLLVGTLLILLIPLVPTGAPRLTSTTVSLTVLTALSPSVASERYANTEWRVVLDGDTSYHIPPSALTDGVSASLGQVHYQTRLNTSLVSHLALRRAKRVLVQAAAQDEVQVTFLGNDAEHVSKIDCGKTPFVQIKDHERVHWKLCVPRDMGEWRNGRCHVVYYLDQISLQVCHQLNPHRSVDSAQVETEQCAFLWRKIPRRSRDRMEAFFVDKPHVEVYHTMDADDAEIHIDWWRMVDLFGVLLSCVGVAVCFGSLQMAAAAEERAKRALLPN